MFVSFGNTLSMFWMSAISGSFWAIQFNLPRVRARLGRVCTSPRCDKGGVVEDIKLLHNALAMYTVSFYLTQVLSLVFQFFLLTIWLADMPHIYIEEYHIVDSLIPACGINSVDGFLRYIFCQVHRETIENNRSYSWSPKSYSLGCQKVHLMLLSWDHV